MCRLRGGKKEELDRREIKLRPDLMRRISGNQKSFHLLSKAKCLSEACVHLKLFSPGLNVKSDHE